MREERSNRCDCKISLRRVVNVTSVGVSVTTLWEKNAYVSAMVEIVGEEWSMRVEEERLN